MFPPALIRPVLVYPDGHNLNPGPFASLAVMLPTMLSGALGHHKRGAVDWKAAAPMGIAAIIGGLLGGTLAAHLPGFALRVFFALIVIVTAVQMVRHKPVAQESCDTKGSAGVFVALGFCIGIVSGLTGLGGGALLVPVLVILLCYPIHKAIGTSSACLIFSSAGAVTAYAINGIGQTGLPALSIGYIDILSFAVLAVTTIPLARLGVRFAHACSGRSLQVLFACLQVVIGASMLLRI